MSKESWFKALSFLPSRFHTADSPVEVLRRAMNPEPPAPTPTPQGRVIQMTLSVPQAAPAPARVAAQPAAPQPSMTLAPSPAPAHVPSLVDVMRGGVKPDVPDATPLTAEPASTFVPELDVIPDEVLLASYDPALEDHLVWEGPHFAPDIPDTLNVPPPTTTLPEVVMSEEETALARLSEQFRARAAQAGQHGDAFHLPDFGPDEVDETQQLLNSLRGRGQQAIRSGLQSYLN